MAALTAAGCGSSGTTQDITGCRTLAGYSGFGLFGYNPHAARPATRVAAFRRQRRPGDTPPRDAFGDEVVSLSSGDDPKIVGKLLRSKTRLLLERPGDHLGSIYAAPTTTGLVCYGALNLGLGGCPYTYSGSGFDFSFVDPGGPNKCAPLQVLGILPDDATRVSVIVNGRRYRATLGENAFYFSDPNAAERETTPGIVVRYRDGRTEMTQAARREARAGARG